MEREETFETTTNRGTLIEVTVRIKNEERGSFEISDVETGGDRVYAEGGLWFNKYEGVNYLRDYDGVFELPEYIMNKLVKWGYSMDHI
jgi:hypothetical protein